MSDRHRHIHHAQGPAGQTCDDSYGDAGKRMATDRVCGMKVDLRTSKHHAEHGGQALHFCSARCHTKFVDDPGRYLKAEAVAAPAVPEAPPGTIYTCPMLPRCGRSGTAVAQFAAWRWNWRRSLRRRRRTQNWWT